MTKKSIYEQDFSDMADFDDSLDINQILDSQPALDTDGDNDNDNDDDTSKKKDDDDSTLDINQVLENQLSDNDNDDNDDEGDDDDKQKDASTKKDGDPALKKTDDSSSDAPFTVIFARDLVGQGTLSSFDEGEYLKLVEEVGEAEAFKSLIRSEIEDNINAAKEDLDEGYKQYLSLTGKGVDPDTALSLTSLQDRFSKITEDELEKEDNEDLRKSVLTDYFKLTTQLSDSKIEKMVQRSIDLGDDIEDAKESLSTMKELVKGHIADQEKKAKEADDARREESKRQLNLLRDQINSLTEIIPGQGINKQTKAKLYDLIVKPTVDKNGRQTNALWAKRAEDPLLFDAKLAYLVETGFFEKDKPWTKIKAAKTTQEASELERYLSNKNNTGSSSGRGLSSVDSGTSDIKDIIAATRSILNK